MNPSDVPFEGLKIQLKGRMSGKGGKAAKKVWVWGRTGRKAVDDPVDYAHEAVITRAGYIGIKVGRFWGGGGGAGGGAEQFGRRGHPYTPSADSSAGSCAGAYWELAWIT